MTNTKQNRSFFDSFNENGLGTDEAFGGLGTDEAFGGLGTDEAFGENELEEKEEK